MNEGLNRLKIVGKPVTFQSLNIVLNLNNLKKENVKSLVVLRDQLSFKDESKNNLAEKTEIYNTQVYGTGENTTEEQMTESKSVKKDEIEEGKFFSLSYLKLGNTLLSGTGIRLNGKKILVEINLPQEEELEIEVHYKKKSGQCRLVLIDGNGEETIVEDDITEGTKTILLSSGNNTLILDGVNASFSAIDIESNTEELINE